MQKLRHVFTVIQDLPNVLSFFLTGYYNTSVVPWIPIRPFDIVPTKRTNRGKWYRQRIIQDAISVRDVSIKIRAIRK